MQVVIVEQEASIVEGQLRHRWNVQLLQTGEVVARITEGRGGICSLATYGDHPSGNRYRTFEDVDRATDVVIRWAGRRFRPGGRSARRRVAVQH